MKSIFLSYVLPTACTIALLSLVVIAFQANWIEFGDPGPRGELGVKRLDDRILVRFKGCEDGPLITSLTLHDTSNDEIVWRIESPVGSANQDFVLGTTPPEFEEVTKLTQTPKSGTRYVVVATLLGEALRPGTEFDPGKLEGNVWRISARKKLTDAELDKLEPCI